MKSNKHYARGRRRKKGHLSFVALLRLQRGGMRPRDGGFHQEVAARRHAVEVGVVADIVQAERGQYIAPVALLQHPRLGACQLECASNMAPRKDLGDAQRGVIAGRGDVVLGVEPEDHVDIACLDCGRKKQKRKQQCQQPHAAGHGLRNGSGRRPAAGDRRGYWLFWPAEQALPRK